MTKQAILVLADGSVFHGQSIGFDGIAVGEAVFNTSMSGYQESLSDPAAAGQILAFTYPHIGNTGITAEDDESAQVWAAGLVIRDMPLLACNFRCEQNLSDYLQSRRVVAIAGVDTRRLTRILREQGNLSACIMAGDEQCNVDTGLAKARQHSGLQGQNLVSAVTCSKLYSWQQTSWELASNSCAETTPDTDAPHVVVYDFGVRRSLLRALVGLGLRVTVVPAQTAVHEALALQPDGIVLSDGPGDPAACVEMVSTVKGLITSGTPLFAEGLGMLLLALAAGAETVKATTSKLGANHPVKNLASGNVMITQQKYSFIVQSDSLPDGLRMTHQSLLDNSVQGLELVSQPQVFGFAGVAQPSNAPNSTGAFFDRFVASLKA